VDACLAAIERNPTAYAVVHKQVRRALLRRFPYGIFYLVEGETIIALACFHGSPPCAGRTFSHENPASVAYLCLCLSG
jgi:hypothetical protein